jgi:two-component sensor histidine kinase
VAANRVSFEPGVESVHEARRLVRDVVSEAGGDPDTAEMLTAELATNAVVHAQSPFEVRWERAPGSIRVEIVNDEPEMIPRLVEASDTSGRGLLIVDRLARAWGVEALPESKIVWFELPTTDAA